MPPPSSLATLNDVKTRLNIDLTDTTHDAELTDYLNSATTVLQNLYGDVIPTQYTETIRPYGDGTHLLCGRSPLISLDTISVTWPYPSSPTINLTSNLYFTNLVTGEITVFAFSPAFAWQYALRDWSTARFLVTYTAGRAAVSPAVKDAVLEIIRINYEPQRAGGYTPNEQQMEQGFVSQGYYIPNNVHERLMGGERPRQIA